jgi:hypothetical protein
MATIRVWLCIVVTLGASSYLHARGGSGGGHSGHSSAHSGGSHSGPVYVHGYFRSNGTYVHGYWRSSPDGNTTTIDQSVGNTQPAPEMMAQLRMLYLRRAANLEAAARTQLTPLPMQQFYMQQANMLRWQASQIPLTSSDSSNLQLDVKLQVGNGVGCKYDSSALTEKRSNPDPRQTNGNDGYEYFVTLYGEPDLQWTSERDVPKPWVVTKSLVYKKEGVRVILRPVARNDMSKPIRDWQWEFARFAYLDGITQKDATALDKLAARINFVTQQSAKKGKRIQENGQPSGVEQSRNTPSVSNNAEHQALLVLIEKQAAESKALRDKIESLERERHAAETKLLRDKIEAMERKEQERQAAALKTLTDKVDRLQESHAEHRIVQTDDTEANNPNLCEPTLTRFERLANVGIVLTAILFGAPILSALVVFACFRFDQIVGILGLSD